MIASKILVPFIAALIVGIGGYVGGVTQVSNRPLEIKTEAPFIPPCPVCPPTLGNELEKVKGKYVTVNLYQNINIEMESDTLILKKIGDTVEARMNKLKLSKCK